MDEPGEPVANHQNFDGFSNIADSRQKDKAIQPQVTAASS